jgi:hypothetical protein
MYENLKLVVVTMIERIERNNCQETQSVFSFGNMQCLDMDCDKVHNIVCCFCSDILVEILYDFA